MKETKWKGSCERCAWETELMSEGAAEDAAREHDCANHPGGTGGGADLRRRPGGGPTLAAVAVEPRQAPNHTLPSICRVSGSTFW